ncbi:riboflavin synthase domain-like protein [Xylariaceae sp. AK1471]|nr:riboflavin synthase domain-like protein [Xylariaceae sp. AK1471]
MASEQDSAQNGNVETLVGRKMLILYGSETGNSEDAASDIERMARRLHFQTLLEEMDDVGLSDLLQYSLIVFVISTTGQGDLPKNARKFWKSLLRKRLPPNCLRQVNFTTFGLGDSSYFQYNWAARKLHKRLKQLGAREFLPCGEADERHEDGIDGTFLPWCLSLRTYLEKEYPLPPGLSPIPSDVQLTPKFTIELAELGPAMVSKDEAMPDIDAAEAGSTSQFKDASQAADSGAPSTNAPRKETVAGWHAKYDVDNQGRQLDREAALFSHVDDSPRRHEVLKYEHQIEDRMSFNHVTARLSDPTAKDWPGGIDILDRPNVLRDAPTKYSLNNSAESTDKSPPASLLPIPGAWTGVVDENIRLTPASHWQDVRQLGLRIHQKVNEDGEIESLVYAPGDVAVIYPKNFEQDVQTLIDLMGWGDVADKSFIHHCQSTDVQLPCMTPKNCYPLKNSTLRDLLIHNYDITCIPRRTFFTEIAHYTEDPAHKERLREFADPGYSDEFWDYTSRPRRSILEVLQDFPTVRIPYQHVPAVFPVIRGREYSIASGGYLVKDPRYPRDVVVDLVVALVKYKTVLRKTRQGLCSRYIASLKANTPINIKIRENKIPDINTPEKPLLAIATGTGVAPVRALAHEREELTTVKTLLFYGGRNRTADFYFENEWNELEIQAITAFSRDQPDKIYVQDRLLEHYEKVCKFLRKGAAICLCGSSGQMPEAVRLALYDCMVKGQMATDREHAKQILHKDFVFWEEVW